MDHLENSLILGATAEELGAPRHSQSTTVVSKRHGRTFTRRILEAIGSSAEFGFHFQQRRQIGGLDDWRSLDVYLEYLESIHDGNKFLDLDGNGCRCIYVGSWVANRQPLVAYGRQWK